MSRSKRLIILGEPASKANSRRIVRMHGRLFSIKSRKALAYVKEFKRQCKPMRRMLQGDLSAEIDVWYASRRPDLDASLIFDCMQGLIYANDRQIKEQHLRWHLDPLNPRAEILVKEIS